MPSDTQRALVACLRFVLAFALTAFAIGSALPWPVDTLLGPRLAHLRADPDGYDALFVGASGVYRGLDPSVVDAVLDAQGAPLRTYNLGAPGMHSWEADLALRAGMDAVGERLRFVFVEPSHWTASQDNENVHSYRYLFWHTPRTTVAVVRAALAQPSPIKERWSLAWNHGRLGLRRATGFGCAREFLRPWFEGAALDANVAASIRSGGFLALDDDPDPLIAARKETFLAEHAAEFPELVRSLRRANRNEAAPPTDRLASLELAPIEAQRRAIEARGARAIHIVPPYTGRDRRFAALAEAGVIETLIEFTDPDRHPVLYELEHRHDRQHLTKRGARLFSAAFAREFAAVLRNEPTAKD